MIESGVHERKLSDIFKLALCLAFCTNVLMHPSMYASNPNQDLFVAGDGPDKTLSCMGLDSIDIGIGTAAHDAKGSVTRTPVYFSRSQLEYFLKNEKHKDFILVWIEKPMNRGQKEIEQSVAELKSFLSKLEYKRIRIVGAKAFTTDVYFDSSGQP